MFISHFKNIINYFSEIHSILGHPKNKAFITHGGTNGIPMVGIPLFANRPDNIRKHEGQGSSCYLELEHNVKFRPAQCTEDGH